jgi:hypothetical protein
MNRLRRAPVSVTGMAIALLTLLLVGKLVLAAFAQDATPAESPTAAASAEANPPSLLTDIPEASSAPTDMPTMVPTLALPTATDVAPQPSPVPTDMSILPTLTPTDEAPTLRPTDVPSLPSSTPAEATIILVPSAMRLPQNSTFTLAVIGNNLVNVRQIALTCQVNANLLHGVAIRPGEMLKTAEPPTSGTGFQPNGLLVLEFVQAAGAPDVVGSGVLWNLDYQMVGVGSSDIVCAAQLKDASGQPLPVSSASIAARVEGYTEVPTQVVSTVIPPTSIPAGPLPTLPVSSSPIPLPTAVPTLVETRVVPTVVPAAVSFPVSGHVMTSFAQPVVSIAQNSIPISPDNSFRVELPPGQYQMRITAAHHLPMVLSFVVVNEPLLLPDIRLIKGDINGDGVIDRTDYDLIVTNFGSVNPATLQATDLNGDGMINVYDLAIVGANMHSQADG